jgi:L,D-transpeptidase catalytic domain
MRELTIAVGAMLVAGSTAFAAPDAPPPTSAPVTIIPAPILQPPIDTPRRAEPVPNPKRIVSRLRARASAELLSYFDTVLYVSKAARGPWAQHMFVFRHGADGSLELTDSFPVSTGREREEKYFTRTPEGIFEIDPDRIYRMAHSEKWHNAPMPYAMFLNYSYNTGMSGVALHAATGSAVGHLGNRASGGCIRLPPQKAAAFYERARSVRSQVPVLAFDPDRGTTNREGIMVRDGAGTPVLRPGLPILLVVEDYAGRAPADTVARDDEGV